MSHQTDTERRVANLEKLIQVTRSLSSSFDLHTLLQEIIHSVVELVDCEKSSILLIDHEINKLRFFAASGEDFDQLKEIDVPQAASIAGKIVETRQPIVVNQAQVDPRFFSQVDHITGHKTESVMGVPMEIGGRIIGVLEAINKRTGEAFEEEDVKTLLTFAPQAAAAIENTQLIEEQRRRLSESLLIQDVLLTLSRFIQLDQLLEQLPDLLEEFLGYQKCAVWKLDQDTETLRIIAAKGLDSAARSIIPQDEKSVSGWVSIHRELLNIPDFEQQDAFAPQAPDAHAALAVPMMCGEDMVGVIVAESSVPDAFDKRDERILTTIGLQAAIGIRQAELYENALRANRLKQEFITTMSHELRTPMTVVISSFDMLLRRTLGPLNDAQLSTLRIARDRSNLLLRLLNDVLDFSKIAAGDLKLYPAVVDLRWAVEVVIKEYQVYADRKKQQISVDIPSDCQQVTADDKRLRQVLEHLIDNAIKFSPDGRPVRIRVRSYNADYVRIDVIDQGIGIKPEDMGLLFEDFRQLDSSFTRQYRGAGMGLAISKHLVELQGGMIWLEKSKPGQGSTFSFILPRPKASDSQFIKPDQPTPASDVPREE